jgi:hypothetical protein
VPHLSTLQKRFTAAANIDVEYKQDMARILSEVFQNYKNSGSGCRDISLELLWITHEVKNQPYKAAITLYTIIRAIGSNDADIENTIMHLMRICKATLDFGKYDYRDAGIDELVSRVKKINNQSVKAVVKSEGLEVLQNNLMPYCFAFDRIPVTENDLSRIVSSLIDYPDCAVSFQLIPVNYSAEEASAVDRNAQMLDTLSKAFGMRDSVISVLPWPRNTRKPINTIPQTSIRHNSPLMRLSTEIRVRQAPLPQGYSHSLITAVSFVSSPLLPPMYVRMIISIRFPGRCMK